MIRLTFTRRSGIESCFQLPVPSMPLIGSKQVEGEKIVRKIKPTVTEYSRAEMC